MATKIKNRHQLKRKEIQSIIDELNRTFAQDFFDEHDSVETGEIEGTKVIFIDDEACFMLHENQIIFTLHGLTKYNPKKQRVVVDMGAIKFVTNGADVMAPGIVDADHDIAEKDQVWICDEKHHKPLAVGIALMDGGQMIAEKKGKAVVVIHYVGDPLWKMTAKSL